MSSELRRSFKQKAKEAFSLPFRFRMGLEKGDLEAYTGGTSDGTASDEFATRSASFDLGYFTPINVISADKDTKSSVELVQVPASVEQQTEDFVMIEDQDERNKTKPRNVIQPKGTFSYTVSSTDTMASIAAQFETTTSELKKLNRLMSDMVFPGKVIYIPDKNYAPSEPSPIASTPSAIEMSLAEYDQVEQPIDLGDANKACSNVIRIPDPDLLLMGVKPILSVTRQSTSATTSELAIDAKQHEEDWHEQFIKLNVKHVINNKEELVGGVLLVTPNAVMFESSGTDSLVMKNGRDCYDVIIPLAAIVGFTVSKDLEAAKPSMGEVSSFEDDVFCSQLDVGSPAVEASSTVVSSLKDFSFEKHDLVEGQLPETKISADQLSNNGGDNCDAKGQGNDGQRERFLTSRLPLPDVVSCGQCNVQSESPSESVSPNANVYENCRLKMDNFTIRDSPVEQGLLITTENDNSREVNDNDDDKRLGTEQRTESYDTCKSIQNTSEDKSDLVSDINKTYLDVSVEKTCTISDETDNSGADMSVPSVAKQLKTNSRELLSDLSSGLESPRKRCSTLVGNIFRFQSGSSTNEPSDKGKEKDVDDAVSKEQDDRSPVSTPGLVSRTLESLSTYSRPLVDLSSSLFSRSGSDSKSPKKDDDKGESDATFKAENLKEKDNSVDEEQTSRLFFLRPFDLTRLSRGSSGDQVEEINASEIEEPATVYVCLRVGKLTDWSTLTSCPVASYISLKLKHEYWFIVPANRVDHLYAFFLRWSPNINGEMHEVEKDFVVVSSLDSNVLNSNCPGASGKEWEVINAKEVRRMINVAEIESLPMPELSEGSKIMSSDHIRELSFHLHPRAEGCPWQLVYSSDKHGFSLRTLYRHMIRIDSPVLLIIKDDSNMVFGAMLPCALKVSEGFYGSGESYLFSFNPTFKKFSWSGQNNYFIKGNAASLSVGAGEGAYGLWLDGDLYHGRTQPCQTYNNDLLTVNEDFMIKCLEVWKFV